MGGVEDFFVGEAAGDAGEEGVAVVLVVDLGEVDALEVGVV